MFKICFIRKADYKKRYNKVKILKKYVLNGKFQIELHMI